MRKSAYSCGHKRVIVIRGIMRGANDNAEHTGSGPFTASARGLVLPILVVTALYGLPLMALLVSGWGDGALARLCILALSLSLPFLIAYAVLRRATARIDVMPHTLLLHPGFPRTGQYVVPYSVIRGVRVRRGLGGRLARSATLVVDLAGGTPFAVSDLADAEAARAAILDRLEQRRPAPSIEIPAESAEIPRIRAG